jgi:hypothetical protein
MSSTAVPKKQLAGCLHQETVEHVLWRILVVTLLSGDKWPVETANRRLRQGAVARIGSLLRVYDLRSAASAEGTRLFNHQMLAIRDRPVGTAVARSDRSSKGVDQHDGGRTHVLGGPPPSPPRRTFGVSLIATPFCDSAQG